MADNGNDTSRGALLLGVRAINDLNATMKTLFPITGGAATSATAGAATLPANPVGFIVITLPDGTAAKVAYYAA